MMPFLVRAALTGFALWVVTYFVSGLRFVGGDTTLQRIGIIFVVAVIFGLVNAIIKPIVQILSIPLYILTLGLRDASSQDAREIWSMHHVRNAREIGVSWRSCF